MFSATMLLSTALLPGAVAQDRPAHGALAERLYRDGPPAWQRWKQREPRVIGRMHQQAWAFLDGKRNEQWVIDSWRIFKRKDSLFVCELRSNQSAETTIFADGPRYSFALERSSDSAPWVIRNLTSGPPAPPNTYLLQAVPHLEAALEAPRTLEGIPLEELIKDPKFQLHKVTESSGEGGKPTVRVEFSMPPNQEGNGKFERAWVELSPSEDWAVVRAEYTRAKNNRTTIVNEYQRDRDGRARLYRRLQSTWYPEEKVEENYQYTFEELERRDVPEREFSLSAFGLPEPDRPAVSRGSFIHYWLYGGAAVLFGLAVWLKWKAGRP
jgi:desulfoferrodoxin (superoxide reductase-like protein)